MPIVVDTVRAEVRFAEALAMARSGRALPVVWSDWTAALNDCPSKTFTPMLGTALLARATDPRVDPFALKTRDYEDGYSARTLCTNVLVPCAVAAGINLRSTGCEPLNNSPFYRPDEVSRNMVVRPRVKPYLGHLCDALDALSQMDANEALEALAAFLAVRTALTPQRRTNAVAPGGAGLDQVVERSIAYVLANPEGGKRGQAFVAAAFDLVFDEVRTSRINDPSRHWPGDVACFKDGSVLAVVEVKHRNATATEIEQFASKVGDQAISRAVFVALDPRQRVIDMVPITRKAWSE